MTRIPFSVFVIIAVVLAVFGGRAISAQDKYTVQVPNGLAFSEFRGYEDWQVVAVSQSGDLIEVIVANPVMIEAYRAGGLPGVGKHFPDGSKMAKIHWNAKKSGRLPLRRRCRTPCTMLISWSGTARDFRTPAHGDTRSSTMMRHPTRSRPKGPAWIADSRAIR